MSNENEQIPIDGNLLGSRHQREYARKLRNAAKESDIPRRVALLRELTFDTDRKGPSGPDCVAASRQLAQHYFSVG